MQDTRPDVHASILDAADELLARYGYRKMTVEDLAREVGIGKGSVYLHFPSKKAVALATIDRIVDRVVTELTRIADSAESTPEKLARMIEARVMVRFDAVKHYPESLESLLVDLRNDLLDRRREYFRREERAFERVLAQGERDGELAFESGTTAARAIVAATNSLLPYSLSTTELGKRASVQRRVKEIGGLLLDGLTA